MTQSHTLSRRDLVRSLAAAVAAPHFLPVVHASAPRVPSRVHFGVQLNAFPINSKNFQTFLDALSDVKRIGYDGFESGFRFVNSQFANPSPTRQQIESTGLTFFGVHIFFDTPGYDATTGIAPVPVYEEVAHGGAALGAHYLILSGAPATDADMLKRKLDALDRAGNFARSAGLKLAYHNHWWEFQSKLGEVEALYTQTDPALVSFVLDAGHAYHGGADVPGFIRTHQARIAALHLRDYKDGRLSTLGTGTFPLKDVAAAIREIGWQGWVENEEEREDQSHSGAQVIEPAYKAMKDAFTNG